MQMRAIKRLRADGLRAMVSLCCGLVFLLAAQAKAQVKFQDSSGTDIEADYRQDNNLYPGAAYTGPMDLGAGETAFDFHLKGYVLGVPIIKARYKGLYGEAHYQLYTDLKTAGLGALLKKLRIWATTQGRWDKAGMHPQSHTQQNLDKKNRRVEMDYDYQAKTVAISIVPPNGSLGIPPASPKEQFTADDVVSAIFKILLTGQALPGVLCQDTVQVFDSKQRYNLRLERLGTSKVDFDGQAYEAVKCHAYYEPVSGFDPEDLPSTEEMNTPVKIYFINHPEYDINIPVRFSYKIKNFKAVVKLKSMEIQTGQGSSVGAIIDG